MIRIIAGKWRGRSIAAPSGSKTRPSAARLREALFSSLSGRWKGARVVDLFAGSGALGIEALSRGAAHVEFVEIDGRALRQIAKNLEGLGAEPDSYRLRKGDARRWLDRFEGSTPDRGAAPVCLLDPPYSDEITREFLPRGRRLVESGHLAAFVLEHPSRSHLPDGLDEDLTGIVVKTRRHGYGAYTAIEVV